MAAPAQQNQGDNSMGFLWIIVAVFAVSLLIWYVYQDVIVSYYLKLKILELNLVGLFTTSYDNFNQALKIIVLTNPKGISFSQLVGISNEVGSALRIPVVIILGCFALILYYTNVKNRSRNVFDMNKLLQQEKENWPQIAPVAKLNLLEEDIDAGKWAMAMSPMQFAKKHKLIKEEFKPAAENELSKTAKIEAKIIRAKTHAIFSRQMGRPWTGIQNLPPYARALFAIFAAKANSDRTAANDLLRQIAASAEEGKFNFDGMDALLAKHGESKLVKKVISKHAYELTVLASMLEVARTDGVVASAEFLWLKPVDRTLWYMLNAVGRQTAPVEVAGPFAHWLAEKEIGRGLTVPMLEEATKALELAIAELIYTPDEKSE